MGSFIVSNNHHNALNVKMSEISTYIGFFILIIGITFRNSIQNRKLENSLIFSLFFLSPSN